MHGPTDIPNVGCDFYTGVTAQCQADMLDNFVAPIDPVRPVFGTPHPLHESTLRKAHEMVVRVPRRETERARKLAHRRPRRAAHVREHPGRGTLRPGEGPDVMARRHALQLFEEMFVFVGEAKAPKQFDDDEMVGRELVGLEQRAPAPHLEDAPDLVLFRDDVSDVHHTSPSTTVSGTHSASCGIAISLAQRSTSSCSVICPCSGSRTFSIRCTSRCVPRWRVVSG